MTYTHLTTNELVMIEAYYQENIKVSDIVTSLGRSKQTIYNVINYLKERGTLLMISITDIKSIRNAVAGIKPVLRNQKKILSNIFERPSYVFFIIVLKFLIQTKYLKSVEKRVKILL